MRCDECVSLCTLHLNLFSRNIEKLMMIICLVVCSLLSLFHALISIRRLSLKVSTKIDSDHLFRTSIDEARMLVLKGDEENVKSLMNISLRIPTHTLYIVYGYTCIYTNSHGSPALVSTVNNVYLWRLLCYLCGISTNTHSRHTRRTHTLSTDNAYGHRSKRSEQAKDEQRKTRNTKSVFQTCLTSLSL